LGAYVVSPQRNLLTGSTGYIDGLQFACETCVLLIFRLDQGDYEPSNGWTDRQTDRHICNSCPFVPLFMQQRYFGRQVI